MDELLRGPQSTATSHGEAIAGLLHDTGTALAHHKQKARSLWRNWGIPFLHGVTGFARRHPITPLMYLALSVTIGFCATVANVYETSYVVSLNGADIGVVKSEASFQEAVDNVEARASRILGYDYEVEGEITYTRALTERGEFSSAADLETYLFNRIGDIMMGYDLRVNGVTIGSAENRAALDDLLATVAAPYTTENTVDYGFVENVAVVSNYVTSESYLDLDGMYATLTENTTGETTYTVVKGDTYSEIAYDNDMSLDELMALNPQASLDRLMIGDVLNVKKIIPFLSVYTVDNVTYNAVIECPVEYVDDSTMYEGNSKVITQGVEGEAIVNANVTYVNGYETERTILTSETITEPTTTVIARGTAVRPKTASTGTYIWPCSGTLTSDYGYRYIFGSTSFHKGIDIGVPYGTPIKASDGGKVTYAGWKSGGFGYLVVITHDDGTQTYYAHNSSLCVSVGERVYQGQTIAKAGSTGNSTGNHCHFEIRVNGKAVNPYNYL